jgi:hypothetical protein
MESSINHSFGVILLIIICLVACLVPKKDNKYINIHQLEKFSTITRTHVQFENKHIDWMNGPLEQLKFLTNKFGKPDLIDQSQGGLAIWKRQSLEKIKTCWEHISVEDEDDNYVSLWISVKTDKQRNKQELDKLDSQLFELSPNISFDRVYHILKLRGNSYYELILSIYVAKKILQNDSITASKGKLLLSMIRSQANANKDYYHLLEEEFCYEIKQSRIEQ